MFPTHRALKIIDFAFGMILMFRINLRYENRKKTTNELNIEYPCVMIKRLHQDENKGLHYKTSFGRLLLQVTDKCEVTLTCAHIQ